MTRLQTKADTTAPLWAVFGAPLVGVPLMVAVLALGAGPRVDSIVEPDVGFHAEQVEMAERDAGAEASGLHND